MKTIFLLLRNPFIKIIGVVIVLYFGLFNNKENKSSLGYRLSKENISKNIDEVKEHSTYIVATINDVKSVEAGLLPAEVLRERASRNQPRYSYDDVTSYIEEEGNGVNKVECGDQAKISYKIYVKATNVELDNVENQVLIIGSKKNKLLEDHLIGIKEGAVKIINIPKHSKVADTKLASLLKFNETDLYYKIKLLKFSKSLESINCN